ncbi:MAG: amino acid permease [Crocinitomicaceae bacterium]|nr:amino acid permease [Crocinitomicaceae bacterium]
MNISTLFRKKSIEQILQASTDPSQVGLAKHLGVKDLTSLGIAAIIGAGIFTTIGQASADGGPAVAFLFIFTSIACGFAAFAYAEFASVVPVSGSAYTYSYVAFGELFAWVIGWALIMEYAIGNITVAIGWSGYFTELVASMGLHFPAWTTIDYFSASNGFKETQELLASGTTLDSLTFVQKEAYTAWLEAPSIGGLRIIADFPALFITFLITWLVYKGIKESKNAANAMVIIKISVVLLVIAVGAFYVDIDNWNPFAPNGISGVLKGVSAVFFAYIGFDAISTTAEECKNPQRDLPRGMMWAIIICTILYILIALVLTGMVKYTELAVNDPLAFVFKKLDLKWLSGIIAVSAVIAMASVLLVFQIGQPRIWMSMSRDGLLPKRFAKIHPKHNTPAFSTIITGVIVGGGALFLNMETVTDLCSIGTLFAFVLVCAGVLRLEEMGVERKFKTPYVNSKWILPIGFIVGLIVSYIYNTDSFVRFITSAPEEGSNMNSLVAFFHNVPMWIFFTVVVILIVRSFTRNYSLIPVLGLVCCLYMMAQIELKNWIGFMVWLVIGLVIYFLYGNKHSKLAQEHN